MKAFSIKYLFTFPIVIVTITGDKTKWKENKTKWKENITSPTDSAMLNPLNILVNESNGCSQQFQQREEVNGSTATNCNSSFINDTLVANMTKPIERVAAVSCSHTASTWSQIYEEYVTYILVAFGLVGNSLSVAVISGSSNRHRASRLYLLFLSIADSLVLIFFILSKEVQHINNASCVLVNYCNRLFRSFSGYLVVMISIQRFTMVKYPFKASHYDRTLYGVLLITASFLFAAVSSLYQALISETQKTGKWKGCCRTNVNVDVFIYLHLSLHVLCVEVIASLIVLILTFVTVNGIRKSNLLRSQMSKKVELVTASSSGTTSGQKETKSSEKETQLTKMLIVLALVFVFVRMPFTITYWYDYLMWFIHWRSGRPASAATYTLNMMSTINVFFTLYIANFATNFLVYIILWPAFRLKVVDILTFKYSRKRKKDEVLSYSASNKVS